ncbi:hypothetical protein K9L16_02340 [Candidatus Pacearchaeota archaeon]|nr:hypothetical protein [Candidatus Pacearchaeota archaeon]
MNKKKITLLLVVISVILLIGSFLLNQISEYNSDNAKAETILDSGNSGNVRLIIEQAPEINNSGGEE